MKKLLITLGVILSIFLLIFGIIKYNDYKNNKEIANSIHGLVITDYAPLYSVPKTDNVIQIKTLNKADKVYILDQFNKDGVDWYKVKVDGNKNGYVRADTVGYYKKEKSDKVLIADVSQFSEFKIFKTPETFATFLVEDNISGVYIRAGGNHYVDGQFEIYEDDEWQFFVEGCEYIGIPYGFYFADYSRDINKAVEMKDYIKTFLNNHKGPNCKLPVCVDVETSEMEEWSNELWALRIPYIKELNNLLRNEDLKPIYYINASLAYQHIDSLDVDYWLAFWPENGRIPDSLDQLKLTKYSKNEFLRQRTVGWQFTYNGVPNLIDYKIDISIFDESFLENL